MRTDMNPDLSVRVYSIEVAYHLVKVYIVRYFSFDDCYFYTLKLSEVSTNATSATYPKYEIFIHMKECCYKYIPHAQGS